MGGLKINVVNNFPQEEIISVEKKHLDFEGNSKCLYVPLPREANLTLIDSVINHLPIEVKSPDLIVFRFHSPDLNRIKVEKQLSQIRFVSKRFDSATIYFLYWSKVDDDYVLEHQEFSKETALKIQKKDFIEILRHAELKAIISESSSILNKDSEFHYVFPNGKHYNKFLRVGNALTSKEILNSICFWLLPYTLNKPKILIDSNSIISVGLNLIHYCNECEELDGNWIGGVECLSRYYESDIEISEKILTNNDSESILNIFSVSGSGRLLSRINSICDEHEISVVKNAILFSANPSVINPQDDEIFCELDKGFLGVDKSDCDSCQNNSVGIKIDEKSYRLDIQASGNAASLSLPVMRSTAAFFNKYHDTNCFNVHRDQHDGKRHHMIHIDILELLKNAKFVEAIKRSAEKFRNDTDILLAPEHEAAEEMVKVLNDVLNIPVIISDHQNLDRLSPDKCELIRNSRNILIVDDVVITGKRLNEYKEFLDRCGLKTKETVIKLFVGVARPESEDILNGIKDYLFPHENFESVEQLILPNWDEKLCPWCYEENLLKNSKGRLTESELLDKRIETLDRSKGLSKDMFLQWGEEVQLKHGKRDTVFGPMSDEVEIFVAIASIIQTMRAKNILHKVDSDFTIVAKNYDLEKYLTGRYYEDFIRACIFRASVKHDIYSSRLERKLKEKIESLLNIEEHSSVFIPELIFNTAHGKLPFVKPHQEVFVDKDEGITSFLQDIMSEFDNSL